VWRSVPSAQAAVAAIEHGRADFMAGLIPAAQYRQLSLQAPAQLHSSPVFSVDFAAINTHLAPFNDRRVRQALNYAINRRTIVQLYGGPSFASPTCQPIAPGLPGYRRFCPYTLHPHPSGAWSAPNLARARQLIRESGTRGERIDVWGDSDNPFSPPPRYRRTSPRCCGPSATASISTSRPAPRSLRACAGISSCPSTAPG